MIDTLFINLLAVLFSWIASIKDKKIFLIIAFSIIFIFLALRYDFGNDYMSYYYIHQDIQETEIGSFQNLYHNFFSDFGNKMEIGYILLNQIIPNFYVLVALISFLNCYAFYTIIERYVPSKYWWFSVFIYVFNPFFMLIHSSAMRQSIAISIFMLSLKYLIERKLWRYLTAILLCCLFHYSAIILFPLYFINTLRNIGEKGKILFGILPVITYLLFTVYQDSFYVFVESNFKKYDVYCNSDEVVALGTGLGLVFMISMFILILSQINAKEKSLLICSRISALYFIIYPIGFCISMVGRLGMYFSPVHLVALPSIILMIKQKPLRNSYILAFIFFNIYGFYSFFKTPLWQKFYIYKTILDIW